MSSPLGKLCIILTLPAVCCLLPATSAHAQIIADSVADFSGTQGLNSFYYGYYATPANSATFTQMTVFGNPTFSGFSANVWSETGGSPPPYTALNAVGGHPGGSNYGLPEHWAVRRYLSEAAGTLILSGNIAKIDTSGGTGIIGSIYRNGSQIYSQSVAGTDGVGVNYSLQVTNVAVGDVFDFCINPNGNDFNDTTRFTATVQAVPEPGALGLMAVTVLSGSLLLRRRARRAAC